MRSRRFSHAVLTLLTWPPSENLLPNGLRKIDEGELTLVEQIVVSAFVNDPHQIVLGGSRIGHDSIHLAENEGGFIPRILEAQREWIRWLFHGLSRSFGEPRELHVRTCSDRLDLLNRAGGCMPC
jgi:hypothetical protein